MLDVFSLQMQAWRTPFPTVWNLLPGRKKNSGYRINTEFALNSKTDIIGPSLDNARVCFFLQWFTGLVGVSWTSGATKQLLFLSFLSNLVKEGLNIVWRNHTMCEKEQQVLPFSKAGKTKRRSKHKISGQVSEWL